MKKYILIPDQHIPYNDKKYWKLLKKVIGRTRPNGLVILGDFADFYSVSSHSKDPNRVSDLAEEVDSINQHLDELDVFSFIKEKIFIAGNHCNRLERYLQDKAPELFNSVKISKLFALKERGWKYVPYKESIQIGKLWLTHDAGVAGRYAHYKTGDAYQDNVAIGHSHRLGWAVEGTAKGVPHVYAHLGWGGDINAVDYMHKVKAKRDWAQGFGIAYVEPSGNFHLHPVAVVDYSVVVEGKLIK